jgi:hypothetical protein
MKTKLLILLIGFVFVGCGNNEEPINETNSIETDTLQLPASQLMVVDSIRQYNYKGKGIREY